MEPFVWGFIGTAFGATVGATSSILTTYINNKNGHKLQKLTDELKRDELRRSFLRENLLKLQEELAENIRMVSEVYRADIKWYKNNQDSNKNPRISDELDERLTRSNRTLSLLLERVAEDKLRKDIDEYRSLLNKVLLSRSEYDSTISIRSSSERYSLVMKDIGKHLRELY